MIISLNWLKKYVDLSGVTTEELVELIGARLVEVEGTLEIGEKYRGAKIVRVASAEKIAGSDHLNLCQIDDAGAVTEVERDQGGLVQVVCGANNVHTGMLAVWLTPGMTVPETFGGREPFVLAARKLMGVTSNGMLASIRELDLGDDHDGIVEINPDHAQPGDDFAAAFDLDDTLLDIENKSLTHRPDCFGIVGFAREVAGILGQEFTTPEWLDYEKRAGRE